MLKVLIAEDEDIIRKGLVYTTDWLGMGCVVVAEAANGQEGLEKILECRPDVVIADICMPFLDGIEMMKKAAETVKFKGIVLTSYAEFDYARRAIDARVCEYLLKPVDEEKLAETMKRLNEEITNSRQVEFVMEQAELEGGNMNLDYYMQLDVSENRYISKMIEEIRVHYADKLSVETISEELGVSASYLSRKFKEVTGQTFLDFLNKYRVQQAVVMLNTRQYRISEISEATGFTDYKYFCAVFKKYTLKSPTKFIKGI
ncbi:MAG: response regulator [Clostridiaceae bacterium]|nr:response regulator [Clostridiaceae bacterium]